MIIGQVLLLLLGAGLATIAGGIIWFVVDYVRFRRGVYIERLGPVAAFADKYSYRAGEPIDLRIHSTGTATLARQRLTADGWTTVGASIRVPPCPQSPRFDKRSGFTWTKTLTIETGGLGHGLYRFVLTPEAHPAQAFSVPIIIKDGRPRDVSVIIGTNTWEAYTTSGGLSHYENRRVSSLSKAVASIVKRPQWFPLFVPSRRPNNVFSDDVTAMRFETDYTSFMVRNEIELLFFLLKQGYDFSVFDDRDLAFDPLATQAKALLFPGHSEYWTDEMLYAFERFLLKGGKVFRINAGLEGHCVWTDKGLAFKPRPPDSQANMLVGTHNTDAGKFTAAPFRVLRPDHWIFSGTGLAVGDLFGRDSANRPDFDVPGHQHWRQSTDITGQPLNGASGFFTAKVGVGSGPFAVLAVGTNPQGPAHMVYRDGPNGGWVFNASSISFNGAVFRDDAIAQIVCNLMDDIVKGTSARTGVPAREERT